MAEKEKPAAVRRDHFSKIQTPPLRSNSSLAAERKAAIEEIENLEARLRRMRALIDEDGGGSGYAEPSTAFDAVGSDGKLGKVVRHSTYAAPSTFPTLSQVGASAGDHTKMDGTEIIALNTGATIYASLKKDMIALQGAHRLEIWESLLSQDMSIIEWDVCDSGSPAKALFISSEPFPP